MGKFESPHLREVRAEPFTYLREECSRQVEQQEKVLKWGVCLAWLRKSKAHKAEGGGSTGESP